MLPTTSRNHVLLPLALGAAVIVWFGVPAYFIHRFHAPAGMYTRSTSNACDALYLGSDGTWSESLKFVHDGEPKYTIYAKGTWQRPAPQTIVLSSGFVGDTRERMELSPVRADFNAATVFVRLDVHTTADPTSQLASFDKSITGSPTCILAGLS